MNKNKIDKFKIKICKNQSEWDRFVIDSLNSNVFSIWEYMRLEKNINNYFCLKNDEKVAAFTIKTSKNKKDIIAPEYLIYTPIIYRKSQGSSNAKINLEKYEIVNFFCEYLSQNFRSFDITFDFFTEDIRPFLWLGFPNYKRKVETNIRYTSILDLKKIDNKNFTETTLFKNFSNTLRQQYRHSLKENFKFKEFFSKEIFINLMSETLELQDIEFKTKTYENIANKLEVLNDTGFVKMFCIFNENETPINCSIFSVINNISSFMFSARSNKVDNKNYSGISILTNSFLSLKILGIEFVDLEGINSPKRGFYKLGLGGNIKNYFNIKLNEKAYDK